MALSERKNNDWDTDFSDFLDLGMHLVEPEEEHEELGKLLIKKILAISGSPHRNGLTAQIINEVAQGVKETGADIEVVLLAEKDVKPCIACSSPPCWQKLDCSIQDDDGLELRRMMNESDALIFGAPVYFLSINGLAKDFMDRMRYYGESGKPALPISVAGGTGKGCITALQEICRWLVILGFRPFMPLPVTRYDWDIAKVEARERGERLVNEYNMPSPFDSLAEQIACYESLPFMQWGMTEEIVYLARIAVEGITRRGKAELTSGQRDKLQKAETLISMGKKEEGLKLAVAAQEESMAIFNRLL